MESYTLTELLWAITMVLWPICLVIIVMILKRDISKLLLRISGQPTETDTQPTPTPEPIPTPIPTPEPDPDPLVEVCRNVNSGKYFIVLDSDSFYVITPRGDLIHPYRRFFGEIEERGIDELLETNYLSQIQVDKYFEYIFNSSGYKPEKPTPKGRIYLEVFRNMLKNPNSMPSRMLKYIGTKRQVTWFEIKQYLADTHGYSINSGSLSASLCVLREDRYVEVFGFGDDKTIQFIRDTPSTLENSFEYKSQFNRL